MTEIEIRQAIFEAIRPIAPEADPQTIGADENLREALDIDSFDFLNLLIALHGKLGVEIPESDYGQLRTLAELVRYFRDESGGSCEEFITQFPSVASRSSLATSSPEDFFAIPGYGWN